MTPPTQRTGPTLAIVGSCEGCRYLRTAAATRYCARWSVRNVIGYTYTPDETPSWCPELAPARLALGRALVAADITGPARGVEGQGCCPDVSTLEATEARFACKVAMGLVKWTSSAPNGAQEERRVMASDDTKPAVLSAARLAEIRERADAPLRPMPDPDTRAAYFGQAVADRAGLLAHLDALAAGEVPDGPSVRKLYRDLRWEADGDKPHVEETVAVQMYEKGHTQGRAAGRAEALARLATGDACPDCDTLSARLIEAEAERDAARVEGAREEREAWPGAGWEWDAFALQWFQPGAKGKAIAVPNRARGAGGEG